MWTERGGILTALVNVDGRETVPPWGTPLLTVRCRKAVSARPRSDELPAMTSKGCPLVVSGDEIIGFDNDMKPPENGEHKQDCVEFGCPPVLAAHADKGNHDQERAPDTHEGVVSLLYPPAYSPKTHQRPLAIHGISFFSHEIYAKTWRITP